MSLKGVRNIPLFIFIQLLGLLLSPFLFLHSIALPLRHIWVSLRHWSCLFGEHVCRNCAYYGQDLAFAIISMMMLYGVNVTDAGIFALGLYTVFKPFWLFYWVYGLAAFCRSPIDIGRKFF